MGKKGWMGIFIAVVFLAGCATNGIDWKTRVGTYSYDQALVDLGPPDESQNLPDGTVIAQWQTTRRTSFALGAGAGLSGFGSGFAGPTAEEIRTKELIFGPDGMLLMVAR